MNRAEVAAVLTTLANLGDACWPWPRSVDKEGYGRIRFEGRNTLAHRATYEVAREQIAAGLTVDHLCHNRDEACVGGDSCPHRRCVNPAHLGVVTARANSQGQQKARKTHCVNGHLLDAANTAHHPRRACRRCIAASQRAYLDRRRVAAQERED